MKMNVAQMISFLIVLVSHQVTGQDIFVSAREGNTKRIKELIKIKPDTVNAVDENGTNPLIIACYRGQTKTAKLLVTSGAKVNMRSPEGSALQATCYQSNTQLATFLIESGAELNTPGPDGNTALMYAVMKQNEKLVKILTEAGADLKARNNEGKTAHSLAMEMSSLKIQQLVKIQ